MTCISKKLTLIAASLGLLAQLFVVDVAIAGGAHSTPARQESPAVALDLIDSAQHQIDAFIADIYRRQPEGQTGRHTPASLHASITDTMMTLIVNIEETGAIDGYKKALAATLGHRLQPVSDERKFTCPKFKGWNCGECKVGCSDPNEKTIGGRCADVVIEKCGCKCENCGETDDCCKWLCPAFVATTLSPFTLIATAIQFAVEPFFKWDCEGAGLAPSVEANIDGHILVGQLQTLKDLFTKIAKHIQTGTAELPQSTVKTVSQQPSARTQEFNNKLTPFSHNQAL